MLFVATLVFLSLKKNRFQKISRKAIIPVLAIPLIAAGAFISNTAEAKTGTSNFVNPVIEVYVNTQGGPVHYGEGETSNVQTYTNTTNEKIYIDKVSMIPSNEIDNINVGQ